MVTQEVELPVAPTALLTRCACEPFVFLLDGGSVQSWAMGRALLGFRPRATLRITADGEATMCDGARQQWRGDPFTLLDRFHQQGGAKAAGAAFLGGGVLAALSYDLRHWIERLPHGAPDDLALPVLHAAYYEWLLSYSYTERRYQLSSAFCSPGELRVIADRLQALAAAPAVAAAPRPAARPILECSKGRYLAAVRAVLDYIAAGDVYQVNLAQRFAIPLACAPAALFDALQRHAMPFAAYVNGGDFVLVSNSPECFLTLQGDVLATFPIKGTRPRGADESTDGALLRALQENVKERAEHVMIVDLERNDLGKVCRTGSIRVEEFARLQTFPSLHHLVSKVTGRLREGTPLADILRGTFPGGSITGAPKVRAMEIIDELEPVRRGFYTGAIGFIGGNREAVFNLAIRTAVATGQKFTYHAGGGIVADSDPNSEYEETLLKAQPLFAALAAAVG